MNRSLPRGDRGRRSPDTGRASGFARAVPSVRRLARRVTAHSAGRPKIASGAPQLAHVCPSRCVLAGGNIAECSIGSAVSLKRPRLYQVAGTADRTR